MNRSKRIIDILTQALAPGYLELRDESGQHKGHAGARPEGETHYRLLIASAAFSGLNKVQCHQKIYALLADEFKSGLHALAIEIKN